MTSHSDPADRPEGSPALRKYPANYGEIARGIDAVVLPLGSPDAIERLARDCVAFGFGMGQAAPQSHELVDWHEKADAAHKALMENVQALARRAPSEPATAPAPTDSPLSAEARAKLLTLRAAMCASGAKQCAMEDDAESTRDEAWDAAYAAAEEDHSGDIRAFDDYIVEYGEDLLDALAIAESPKGSPAHPDSEILDALEAEVNREPLLLHTGNVYTNGFRGLGLRPGSLVRTLREALDDMRGAARSRSTGDAE